MPKKKKSNDSRPRAKKTNSELVISSYADHHVVYEHIIKEHAAGPGVFGQTLKEAGFSELGKLALATGRFVVASFPDIYAPIPVWEQRGYLHSGMGMIWYIKKPHTRTAELNWTLPDGAACSRIDFRPYDLPARGHRPDATTVSSADFEKVREYAEMLNMAAERISSGVSRLV